MTRSNPAPRTVWSQGVTWSGRRHAIRPDTVPVDGGYWGTDSPWVAACNGNFMLYADTLPTHLKHAVEDGTVTECLRCIKIVKNEVGQELSELPLTIATTEEAGTQ